MLPVLITYRDLNYTGCLNKPIDDLLTLQQQLISFVPSITSTDLSPLRIEYYDDIHFENWIVLTVHSLQFINSGYSKLKLRITDQQQQHMQVSTVSQIVSFPSSPKVSPIRSANPRKRKLSASHILENSGALPASKIMKPVINLDDDDYEFASDLQDANSQIIPAAPLKTTNTQVSSLDNIAPQVRNTNLSSSRSEVSTIPGDQILVAFGQEKHTKQHVSASSHSLPGEVFTELVSQSNSKLTKVVGGENDTYFLFDNGIVFCFNKRRNNVPNTACNIPFQINFPENAVITDISCYGTHALFLALDQQAFGCGSNSVGQLHNIQHDTNQRYFPKKISTNLPCVKHLACGGEFSVLASDNTLELFGKNSAGQLGINDNNARYNTLLMKPDSGNISQISCGNSHTFILTDRNLVFAIGKIHQKEFTILEHINTSKNIQSITHISSGYDFALFSTSAGVCFGLGNNEYGALGIKNKTSTVLREVKLPRLSKPLTQVATGLHHSLFTNDYEIFVSGVSGLVGSTPTTIQKWTWDRDDIDGLNHSLHYRVVSLFACDQRSYVLFEQKAKDVSFDSKVTIPSTVALHRFTLGKHFDGPHVSTQTRASTLHTSTLSDSQDSVASSPNSSSQASDELILYVLHPESTLTSNFASIMPLKRFKLHLKSRLISVLKRCAAELRVELHSLQFIGKNNNLLDSSLIVGDVLSNLAEMGDGVVIGLKLIQTQLV